MSVLWITRFTTAVASVGWHSLLLCVWSWSLFSYISLEETWQNCGRNRDLILFPILNGPNSEEVLLLTLVVKAFVLMTRNKFIVSNHIWAVSVFGRVFSKTRIIYEVTVFLFTWKINIKKHRWSLLPLTDRFMSAVTHTFFTKLPRPSLLIFLAGVIYLQVIQPFSNILKNRLIVMKWIMFFHKIRILKKLIPFLTPETVISTTKNINLYEKYYLLLKNYNLKRTQKNAIIDYNYT